MKKSIYIITISLLLKAGLVTAQTIDVGASPLNLPCGGGNVNLTALGNSSVPVFGDNFNTGSVSPGWLASPAAQFNNPCGPSMDGTTYLWMGPGTAAPRTMQTAAVDVSCGGTVCFDFKFTCESCGDNSPCEGADFYNEGVSLQWSTDGGATWTDMAYFAPNGNLLGAYPGAVTSPYASGATPFTTWQNYCFTIPAGAFSPSTMFRMRQWGSSGSIYDHWGIDNFYVYATPCTPFYYDWAHIPGAPDAQNVTANITTTTTFTCCYTNGTLSACEDVTVVVATIPQPTVTVTHETCAGTNDGSVIIDNPGGSGPYDVEIFGPVNDTYTEGNGPPDDLEIDNLPDGTYTYIVTSNSGCTVTGTFTVNPGIVCCTTTASSTPALCFGGASGTATANPSGGVPAYTYQWFNASMVPIGQTTQTASGLTAGTYNVTVTDNTGCQATASVVVTQPTAITATATPTSPLCFGACNGSITVNAPSGGTPGYQYSINGGAFGASPTFSGLCAGTYNILVRDANLCTFPISVTVNQPTDVTLAQTAIAPATCGLNNGSVTVVAGGGTAPTYTYTLGATNNTTGVFTGLAPGNYVVSVADNNGCTESIPVTIGASPGPIPFIDVLNDVACFGASSGSVTIGTTGGTAPLTYSIDIAGATPPSPFQASNTFSGVVAGTHVVTVQDANGCTGTVNVTFTQPTALSFTTIAQHVSCNGVCDGEITVNAGGATPPYEYSSNNGLTFQPSNILSDLCAGNINVVVSDANGCLTNAVVPITQPSVLTSTYGFVDPVCHQTPTGEISFSPAGGTPPYSYSIDDGLTTSASSPITGLMAGVYDVAVVDANGCQTVPATVTLTDPPPFDFTFIANNPSNCGANDGSFEIVASNGIGPYLYSIDGGVTIQVDNGFFGGLYSGLYNLVVEDANGCIDSIYSALSDNVMVTQVDFTQDVTCYNGTDGLGIVSQMFGSAPYTYTIFPPPSIGSDVNGTGIFANLAADTYYVTVEDNGLCIAIEEFTINEPDSILFTPTPSPTTCNGGSDGEVTITGVTGGSGAGYQYSIDGGATYQASPTFTGLAAGTYELWVMDNTNCEGYDFATVTEPVPFDVVVNFADLTCNANNSGFIQIVADGSNPGAYSYDLNGTANLTGIYAGLAANNYNITVTDILGCTYNTTQLISEPAQLSAAFVLNDALCNGSCDGSIVVNAAGGTTPYLYSADGGITFQSSSTLDGLCAGTHNIQVKDDNNCLLTSPQPIGEPTLLTMSFTTNPATCGLDNGDFTITANNGTPGYQYSNDNGITFQAANNFTGLADGNYFVVLEDNNGCQINDIVTITADAVPVIDNIVATDPLCNGSLDGTITVSSSAGVGAHQYSINGGAFQASNIFNGLIAGSYTITVQDANLCEATVVVDLVDPPVLTYSAVATDLLCNGDLTGALELTANGGTPSYQFSIDNGVSFQGGGSFGFIAAGNYNVVVEDANGCQVAGIEVVNEPAVLTIDNVAITNPTCYNECDGEINATVIGGTAPYFYIWSGGIGGPASGLATGICDGTYSLNVIDDHGCQTSEPVITVTQPVPVPINAVTPTNLLCFEDNTGEVLIDAPTSVLFSIDNGVTFQAANTFTGLAAGDYQIVVEDADGCQSQSNATLTQPSQVYSIAPSDWFGCFGAEVVIQAFTNGGTPPYNYTWTNSADATVVNADMFNYTITTPAPGIDFTLSVTDANGCVADPVTYNVQSSPSLQATASADVTICPGDETTLSVIASGGEQIDFGSYIGYSYVWTPGAVGDTLESYIVSPSVQTEYIVTVTDLCGQEVEDTVVVSLFDQPIPNVIGGGNGCLPELMTFENPSYNGGTCLWNFGDGTTSTDCGITTHLYDQTGCFNVTLTLTSTDGCVETATYDSLVCISPLPVPGFYWAPHSPSVMDPTITIINNAENTEFYQYNFGGTGFSYEEEPTYTFPSTLTEVTYEVCQYVTSPDGCMDTLCREITIVEEIIIYVPNVFTPDGDPHNNDFTPVITAGVDMYNYHLTIFNRWGEIVFESYDYEYGWDGTYSDQGLVEDGVYIWQIEFGEKNTDKRHTYRGHVTVLK